MNQFFSRTMTLLRKEKQLSQKQVAADLGISQALLSHYEKGIRECGLDFVVKAAEYYDVSCDYLLGRTAERNLTIDGGQETSDKRNTTQIMNRRLINNTLSILYDCAAKAHSRKLSRLLNEYLMVGAYKLLRRIYTADPSNPTEYFNMPEEIYRGYCDAQMCRIFADIDDMCSEGSDEYVLKGRELTLSPDILAQEYPGTAGSLFNVIQHAEHTLNKIKR